MKVHWTEQALVRLAEIHNYIANHNPSAAAKLMDELIERGDSLSRYFKRGRVVPEFNNPEIRELIFRNYRIVYRINPKKIGILTVFAGNRLLSAEELQSSASSKSILQETDR